MKSSHILAALAALLGVACRDEIPLGVEPSLWMADHETGDLSQWKEGGNGSTFTSSDGALNIVENPVHTGRYAVKCFIDNLNNPSLARLSRQGDLPEEAYYSLWVYIPQPYTVGQYWNVFEFSGRKDRSNPNTGVALWSLDLRQDTANQMVWYVYDGMGARELMPREPITVQFGRWVRVTAFMRQATDQTGRVAFWIDDRLLIEESGLSTVPSNWMSWAVGSVAGYMPQPAEIYVDDAMIANQGPPGA